MNLHMHLQPVPGKGAPVDEAVTMDNTLEKAFVSRNRPEQLEWLQDAGFGMFIHWSLDVQLGCVISHSLVGASADYVERYYTELPKTLTASGWDFDKLASLARRCGMQYAVLTTKHHNGFCLWDTETTDFNIMHTPCGTDLVAQYVKAFRKAGIRVGFYFSPEDFRYLRESGLPITRNPEAPYPSAVMEGYRALLKRQMTELVTRYDPELFFFDGGETMRNEEGQSLQQLCMEVAWDLKPDLLVTRGAIPTPEQQLPGIGADTVWEGCITLGTAWQYQPTNEQYKTGLHVIRLLTETRAKGGSLLLNIGPDEDGVLCREQENILHEIGLWQFINGEAMRDVRPWVLTNEGDTWLLQAKDGQTVYAVLFGHDDWDRGIRKEILLRSVAVSEDTTVKVLGQSGELTEYRPDLDAHVYWEQREEGLWISALNAQRIYCGIQWRNPLVLKITHPRPAFLPMQVQTAAEALLQREDSVLLSADIQSLGSFDRAELSFEWRVYPGFALASYEEGWQSTEGLPVTGTGRRSIPLTGLQSGVTYQYRAVLQNERNCMKGELTLFVRE